ncbi:MAG: DUF1173 family protein [Pseudomonadota bacterium]
MEAGSRYLINNIEIISDDPKAQSLLAVAYSGEKVPRCLCVPGGVDMYIAKYKNFVIKRRPDTGKDHSPNCASYEPPAGQSGLGEVLGEAIIERSAELIEVRLGFPLTRRQGRAVSPGEPTEKTEVEVQRQRLGLRGLLHLLWERAGGGLNRWYPRMEGKRSWWVVRKHLTEAAHEIETKGIRFADRLLIPEPFRVEAATEITKRRAAAMSILLSPSDDVQFKMMIAIGELKDFAATEIDYRVVLKHMAGCPLFMEKKAGEKFKKTFGTEYATWIHQKAIEQAQTNMKKPPELRFIFAGLVYAKRENVFHIDTATIMMTTSNWIPIDYEYEKTLADELTRQRRRFMKPLRYESKQGASFPNLILLDTGDQTTALDIVSPFLADKAQALKELTLKQREAPHWVWRTDEDSLPPPLPPVAAQSLKPDR